MIPIVWSRSWLSMLTARRTRSAARSPVEPDRPVPGALGGHVGVMIASVGLPGRMVVQVEGCGGASLQRRRWRSAALAAGLRLVFAPAAVAVVAVTAAVSAVPAGAQDVGLAAEICIGRPAVEDGFAPSCGELVAESLRRGLTAACPYSSRSDCGLGGCAGRPAGGGFLFVPAGPRLLESPFRVSRCGGGSPCVDFEAAADLSGAFLTLRGVGRAWMMRVSVVDLAFAGLAA